jgi:hypothetical protein
MESTSTITFTITFVIPVVGGNLTCASYRLENRNKDAHGEKDTYTTPAGGYACITSNVGARIDIELLERTRPPIGPENAYRMLTIGGESAIGSEFSTTRLVSFGDLFPE